MSRNSPPERSTKAIDGGTESRDVICTNSTSPMCPLSMTSRKPPERRVEATLESDHQRHPALGRHRNAPPRSIEVEGDRFLTENGLGRASRPLDLIGVQICGRRDQHTLDGRIVQHFVGRGDACAGQPGNGRGSGLVGVGDGNQSRILDHHQRARVNAADPASTEEPKCERAAHDIVSPTVDLVVVRMVPEPPLALRTGQDAEVVVPVGRATRVVAARHEKRRHRRRLPWSRPGRRCP